MFNMAFEYCIGEYMIYCRSRQLREKTMISYEQALRLFERWCKEQLNIEDVRSINSISLSLTNSNTPFVKPFFETIIPLEK